MGRDDWRRTDLPVGDGWGALVAARGSASGEELVLDVVLVESPHRVQVRTGPSGSSVTWHTVPLGDPTHQRPGHAPSAALTTGVSRRPPRPRAGGSTLLRRCS